MGISLCFWVDSLPLSSVLWSTLDSVAHGVIESRVPQFTSGLCGSLQTFRVSVAAVLTTARCPHTT